jgi:hypothetical protein
MIDISGITMKELTEYADYCMGKIPIEERSRFPGEMRGISNEVRCDRYHGVESAIIDASPEDKSFIIDIYDSSRRQVMAARIWLNNGRIYLIDWLETSLLYDKTPDGIETFEEFKARITLPKVPAGILKIPERI